MENLSFKSRGRILHRRKSSYSVNSPDANVIQETDFTTLHFSIKKKKELPKVNIKIRLYCISPQREVLPVGPFLGRFLCTNSMQRVGCVWLYL